MAKKTIEVVRSFSQKVSNPKNQYENKDFFCSVKAEVSEEEAEKISAELYQFVKKEVDKSVAEYLAEANKELVLADIKKKPELWAEIQDYFKQGKDKQSSDYGKETKAEKAEAENKMSEAQTELKELENNF